MNVFIKSQFSYCSFVWKFYSNTLNNEIKRLDEEALRLAYKSKNSLSFEYLLKKDEAVNINRESL